MDGGAVILMLRLEDRFIPLDAATKLVLSLGVGLLARKLRGAEIPYAEMDERLRKLGAEGQAARLRCSRA